MSCKNFYRVTSVVVSETAVTLDFNAPVTLTNTQRICFKVCTAIPAGGENLPVVMTANGATVAVWNKYGNPMLGGELKNCKCYCGLYGSTTPHVITNQPRCIGC